MDEPKLLLQIHVREESFFIVVVFPFETAKIQKIIRGLYSSGGKGLCLLLAPVCFERRVQQQDQVCIRNNRYRVQ